MNSRCSFCPGNLQTLLGNLPSTALSLSKALQLNWLLAALAPHQWFVLTVIVLLVAFAFSIQRTLALVRQRKEPVLFPASNSPVLHRDDLAVLQDRNGVNVLSPPLHTRGRHIIDSTGKRFKLVSVNWYGASDELHIPSGLDVRHRDAIARTIRALGFNSVRLPYADQMVRANRMISNELLLANPDLFGSRALPVFEAVVNSLTHAGLAVIPNNHITTCRWCCDGNLCDAMWRNDFLGPFCASKQTESDWIKHWEIIMRPHINNPRVVGADLRNEPRGLFGNRAWAMWAAAAERLGERLLALQPNWLIIVEGTGSANHLASARSRPIRLSVANRLVYSAHVYGWSGWGALRPYWTRNYDSFSADMHHNWSYLLDENIAPVWVAEIGVPAQPNTGDMHYWKNLMRYLKTLDADFGFWAINPRKPHGNKVETYSLIEDDWETPRWDYRLQDMAWLMEPSR